MFGISGTELVIIIIFGFLIFGPDKLPQIAKTVGIAIRKFREVTAEAKTAVDVEGLLDGKEDAITDDPLSTLERVKDKAVSGAKEVTDSAKNIGKKPVNSDKKPTNIAANKVVSETGNEDKTEHKETLEEKKARYDREHPKKDASNDKQSEVE